jgi:hypothetical protein
MESTCCRIIARGRLTDRCATSFDAMVAEAGDGETASLPKAFAPLYFRLLTRAFCESKS